MTEPNWLMAQIAAAQKEFDTWPKWKQEVAMVAVNIWSGKVEPEKKEVTSRLFSPHCRPNLD